MDLLQAQPVQTQGSSLSPEGLRQAFAPRRRAGSEEPPEVVDEHGWPRRLSSERTVNGEKENRERRIESEDGGRGRRQ